VSGGPQIDLGAILRFTGGLPRVDNFLPVDDLIGRFDALVESSAGKVIRSRAGTSRLGEPIYAYTVGDGPRTALVVGGVHPNEPIGSWTALWLAEAAAAGTDPIAGLGFRWCVVPTIDPDGARLNEGWFAEPADRIGYGRAFYRPAPNSQAEWTFPTDYKNVYFDRVLPETLAFLRLIDDLRPELQVSLHNGELGGVYYYISRDAPGLVGALAAIPDHFGLPLDVGEPEMPHLRTYAPAIYRMDPVSTAYDYYENLGVDPSGFIAGSSSSHYAARYQTLCLVAELPYWKHPDAGDSSPTAESYAAMLRRTAADMIDMSDTLSDYLHRAQPHLILQTPFREASEAFIPMFRSAGEADLKRADDEPADRMATVAETFGCEDLLHCFRLRYGGILLRAIEAETLAGTAPAELRRLRDEVADTYAQWQDAAAARTGAEPIPINQLAGVQLAATLAAAAALVGEANSETNGETNGEGTAL